MGLNLKSGVVGGIGGYIKGGPPGAIIGGVGGLLSDDGGGGSESRSGSKSTTNTPAPRDADQQALWDSFMLSVYGTDGYREIKLRELEDLKSQEKSGIKNFKHNVALYERASQIERELSNLGGIDSLIQERDALENKITNAQKGSYLGGNASYLSEYNNDIKRLDELNQQIEAGGGQQPTSKGLLERLEEDAAVKLAADQRLGTTAFTSGVDFLNTLRGQADKSISANDLFGTSAGDIVDAYKRDIRGNTGIATSNIDQMLNTLRSTATMGPSILKIGDFETPFTTGTQRDAQRRFGEFNTQRFDINDLLASNVKNVDLGQANLLNTLSQQNVVTEQEFAGQKLNQINTVAQLFNDITKNNLPNSAENQFLNFLTGQTNEGERLRYSVPSVDTTSNTVDTSSGPSNLDYLGALSDLLGPYLQNRQNA